MDYFNVILKIKKKWINLNFLYNLKNNYKINMNMMQSGQRFKIRSLTHLLWFRKRRTDK